MDRTFNPYSAPQTGFEPPSGGPGLWRAHAYEDQQRKVTFVGIALALFALALLGAIASNLLELSFLEEARAGRVTEAQGEANDQRQLAVVALWWLAYLACVIAISSFLHRANKNARALAGDEALLEYTPGWTVGWFFVPLLNLWKPFRAVQEMFAVSRPRGDGIVGIWWASWIAMSVVGRVSQQFSTKATEIEDFVRANHIDTFHSIVSLVATAMVWTVVRSLHRLQRAHHERGGPDMPA
jgi:hypothetical protein